MNLQGEIQTIREKIASKTVNDFIFLGYLCMLFILTVARFVLHRLGIDAGVGRQVILTVLASIPLCALIISASKDQMKKYLPAFVLYAAVLALIGLTYLFVPSSRYFITRDSFGIVRVLRPDCALYAFLFFFCIDNIDDLLDDLHIYAYLYMAYLTIAELIPALIAGGWSDIGPNGKLIYLSYSLTFGYTMLLPTVILARSYVTGGSKIDGVCTVFGYWAIVTNGNRGAFILFAGFALLLGLDYVRHLRNKGERIQSYLILAGFCLAFLVMKEPVVLLGLIFFSRVLAADKLSEAGKYVGYIILSILIYLFITRVAVPKVLSLYLKITNPGLDEDAAAKAISGVTSSRTQEMLKTGDFQQNNGRKDIWGAVIGAIKTGGIFGRGFFGERPFVFPLHTAAYSHNIILEIISGYGIFGLAMLLYIARDIVSMLLLCQDIRYRQVYLIFFIVSCQLLLSMSFWYVFDFWAAASIAYQYRHAHPEEFKRIRVFRGKAVK